MTDDTQAQPAIDAPEVTQVTAAADPSPAADDPGQQKPPKSGFEKRIDELTKNWRETERLAQETQRDAREARRDADYWRDQALANKRSEPVVDAEPEKTLESFGYDEGKYRAHLQKQFADSATKVVKTELQKEQDAAQRNRRVTSFKERESGFAKGVENYHEVTNSSAFDAVPISQELADVIYGSDEGPAIKFFLASNISLAHQLASLPATQAAREIGRIEAKLVAERAKPAKTVSEAPPPPPKLEGSGDPTIDKDPKDWTDKDFSKWRKKYMR